MNRADRDGQRSAVVGGVLFLLTFGIYNLTLCPTVYWYDSGELISACSNLGIAHPTGYPLYTILGRAFSLLPVGSRALRVNLVSPFFGALTVAAIYVAMKTLLWDEPRKETHRGSGHRWVRACEAEVPAITASLAFAFSPLFWMQTTMAEVYTLHTLLIALLICSLLLWARPSGARSRPLANGSRSEGRSCDGGSEAKMRYLYLFSFLLGLSLGHHLTTLLFGPAFLFLIVAADRPTIRRTGVLAVSFAFLLSGLSVDFYLLIRAQLDPVQNWGNPGTWGRFVDVITGAEIRARPPRYAPHSVGELFSLLGQQYLLPGIALGAVGVWSTVRRRAKLFVFFALFFIAMALYILRNYDFLEDQYLPVFLVFALWIGLGAQVLLCSLHQVLSKRSERIEGLVFALVCAVMLAYPLSLFALNYRSADQSRVRVAHHYGEHVLEALQPESLILSEGSNIPLLLHYFQGVEGRRPDVANMYLFLMEFDWYRGQVADRFPAVSVPILTENLVPRFIEANVRSHPVYYVPFSKEPDVDVGRLIPHGLVFKIEPERTIPSRSELREHFRIQDRFYSTLKDPLDRTSRDILAQLHGTMGLYFERVGLKDEALREYTKALETDPLNPGVHYDLGSFAMGRGDVREAIAHFGRVLELEPSNLPTRYLLARCCAEIGLTGEAIREMERVIRSDPDEPRFRLELGLLYGRTGETDRAVEQFEEALKDDPHNVDILYNAGVAEAKRGRVDAAIRYLLHAEQQDSNSVHISRALASSYAEKKQYGEALHYFQRSLQRGGPDPSILFDLGHLHFQSGDREKAREAWEAALALDPGNAHLREALKRLGEERGANEKPEE